ncbi:MAG: pectinesterase family protein [Prevotella sp.]|nr:pectinesterase family protein [Prevotella sp.]
MKKYLLLSLLAMIAIIANAGVNDLCWDYTNANIPTKGPDNGLYYGAYVNDAAGTNLGLHGVKLNSSGYAYFEKAPVAGKLKLVISNRKNTNDYQVDVFHGSMVDGVPTKGDLIETSSVANGPTEVTIELDETVTGVYICRHTGAEGVLCKVQFVETVPRTFKDFELNFVGVTSMPETLPDGVTELTGSPREDDHGLNNFKMVVEVDGPVKFTIGGCQFSSTQAIIKNGEAVLAEIDVATPGCYHKGGVATWTYNSMEPATLTVIGGQYTPYIKVEACEYLANVIITYFDQNGNKLGEEAVEPGTAFVPKYTVANLPAIADGLAFRGWFNNSGVKITEGTAIDADTKLTAKVTAIEKAETGTHYDYDLTSNTWYQEDHELITVDGSYYNTHGWLASSIKLDVSAKAVVMVRNCQFTDEQTAEVKDSKGTIVASFQARVEADGGVASFTYDGEPTTLTITYPATAYVHGIEVYNVEDFVTKDETTGYYVISSGDVSSLLLTIKSAQEGDRIFLPNGTYDFGETVKTPISANNLSIIGQSADGVIIRNAPDVKVEGLGSADLFQNFSTGLYMQDLTLQNDLDYYKAGTGRAPVLQDLGTQTIMKNVNMRSYQDTYYSKSGDYYFEGGLIQGTVDYICGNGNAYFNGVTLLNKSRSATGSTGDCTITAANTSSNLKGYVFNGCTIETESKTFNFGRSWGTAKTAFLNTTINSGKLAATRWTVAGMNSAPVSYKEYNTVDKSGNGMNTPASNIIEFTHSTGNNTMETVLSAEEAQEYALDKFFTDWAPAAIAAQETVDTENLDPEAVYLVENNGAFVALVKGSALSAYTQGTVRKANARGGFGAAVDLSLVTGIKNAASMEQTTHHTAIYDVLGRRLTTLQKGINIVDGKKIAK